jgi:membrane-bound metal-dependent hydrolase YbcI (DUF457 family)
MPTPIGHALGGIAAGAFIVRRADSTFPLAGRRVPIVLVFALLGMLADVDFLMQEGHRHATHSLAAAGAVGVVAVFVAERRPLLWLASSAAYATHVLLDWLGMDTAAPFGLMALWPFDSTYYQSSLQVFYPVCRQYWLLDCWVRLAWSVWYELLFVGPFALAGVLLMRHRRVRHG